MNATIQITTACYARTPVEGEHSLNELAHQGKLNIRGDSNHAAFTGAVEQATGITLPTEPNTLREHGERRLYWLGPNEWLLHCELDEVAQIETALNDALAGTHCAITDVSDYYTVLHLRSPQAEQLIRNGSPLDIHHSVFGANDFTQTRFGHASILLHKLDDGESWNIQVRWTYAEYVWDYLVSGMAALTPPPK